MMKIAVLIPCYNEEFTIKNVIRDFMREIPDAVIYVFDNNSTDDTATIAAESGAVVKKERRQGKGNVVRTMFREIDADIYIMVDGDDTYPAASVHELIRPIINCEADMVIGDRLTNGTYIHENKRKFHHFGNILVQVLINKLFNVKLVDIMTGYRSFSETFVKNIPLLSNGFEIETEMTLHALDKRFLIKEIPIVYRDRPIGSFSKLNTIKDGIKVIRTIFWIFKDYKPLQFFSSVSFLIFLIGMGVGTPVIIEFILTKFITKVPTAILASSLILLAIIMFTCGIILDTIVKLHRERYELELNKYYRTLRNR